MADVIPTMHTSSVPTATSGDVRRSARIGLIDVARGVAILAVIAYHLVWDLGDFGFLPSAPARSETGENIAHGIAGTFLFLVGVSQVLAHRHGFRRQAFTRRLFELVGYALLISVVTYVVMPSEWISFGILPCIAVASVLVLPFLRPSRAVALGAAGLAVALPGMVEIPGSSRWWSWTGLTEATAPTIDSAPILPLFALTLLGVVVMRTLCERGVDGRLAAVRTDRGVLGALAFLGRHTLIIYVVHQPVLLGILNAVVWLR